MKCSKCDQEINEHDSFCTYCGEQINNEVIKSNKKTNKKLFIIFAIEIVLIVLIALGISVYYNKYSDNKSVTPNEFKEILNNMNYNVEDVTKIFDDEYVTQYYLATFEKRNLGIHYIETDKIGSDNIFYNLQLQLKSQANGMIYEKWIELFSYEYYSIQTDSQYFVVIKKDNNIVSAVGELEYKSEINSIINKLGFDYSANILYAIISIWFVVTISMCIVMWKIFVKAGKKGWQALIPFYNCYCLSKITIKKGWLFIFMLITPINIVFIPVTFYKLAKRFGKSTAFAVCSIFFPYITMQIIAFDNSKYITKNEQ